MPGPVGKKPVEPNKPFGANPVPPAQQMKSLYQEMHQTLAKSKQSNKKIGFFQRLKDWRESRKMARVEKIKLKAERIKQAAAKKSMAFEEKIGASEAEIEKTAKQLEEAKKLKARAQRAASYKPFADACRARGLDPAQAFEHYYKALQSNPNIVRMEFDAKMDALAQKRKFSTTGFYVKYIMEHIFPTMKKQ